jgi:hypothetical protein
MTAEENNATDIFSFGGGGRMLQEQGHNYENFMGSSLSEGVFAPFKLFICSLLSDAFSVTHYVEWYEGMISE